MNCSDRALGRNPRSPDKNESNECRPAQDILVDTLATPHFPVDEPPRYLQLEWAYMPVETFMHTPVLANLTTS